MTLIERAGSPKDSRAKRVCERRPGFTSTKPTKPCKGKSFNAETQRTQKLPTIVQLFLEEEGGRQIPAIEGGWRRTPNLPLDNAAEEGTGSLSPLMRLVLVAGWPKGPQVSKPTMALKNMTPKRFSISNSESPAGPGRCRLCIACVR